jgi:hypothetical protein
LGGTLITATAAELNQLDTNTFTSNITIPADTTEQRRVSVGNGRSGNGLAIVDLVGDATYTTFGSRFVRSAGGPDTSTEIQHRGTGALRLRAQDAGSVALATDNVDRLVISPAGTVTITNLAGVGSRAVTASATGVLSAVSDSRLKEEVPTAYIPSLAEVMRLEPRAYKWLDDIENRGDEAVVEIGFFADEVKDVIPSAAPMGNDGYYGFYDRSITAALVKAVQEQQALILALEARIAALESE